MASTRNINTRGNYNLEQQHYNCNRNYNNFQNGSQGKAYITSIPSIGYMPSHMPRDTLSNNPIEIESMLFGINSTNLVNKQKPIVPELKKVPSSRFFDRLTVHMPKPLIIENNQRPQLM